MIPLDALRAAIDRMHVDRAENVAESRDMADGSFSQGYLLGLAVAQADAARLLEELIKSHKG